MSVFTNSHPSVWLQIHVLQIALVIGPGGLDELTCFLKVDNDIKEMKSYW